MKALSVIILFAVMFAIVGCNALDQLQNENELEKKVRQYLDTDVRLRSSDLTITANMETGEVTLSGEVSLPELIELAGEMTKEVEGVKSVINKITMQELDSGMMQDHVSTPAGTALGF